MVSAYDGKVFDDPDHFECHAGTLKAEVTLRASSCAARGGRSLAAAAPSSPAARADAVRPLPHPAGDTPATARATFQPLPPAPSSSPN